MSFSAQETRVFCSVFSIVCIGHGHLRNASLFYFLIQLLTGQRFRWPFLQAILDVQEARLRLPCEKSTRNHLAGEQLHFTLGPMKGDVMKLESRKVLKRPLPEVYELVKGDLPKLIPYLPNVGKIEVKSKSDLGSGKTELVNHWYAKAELPSMLSKFIKPEIFSWKDVAIWDDNSHSVSYQLTSFLVGDLFEAKGVNSFKSLATNETELVVSCEIKIYPEKVPGVPKLVAGSVRPMIEALIEKIIGPNLASLGEGLEKYFQNT